MFVLLFSFTNLPNPTFLLSNLPLLWHQFLQISCRSLLPVNNAVHRAEGVVASCIKIIIVFFSLYSISCTFSMGDWLDWLLEGDGVQQVTSMPCLSLRTATLLSSHYFDWHSLSCHFTSTHLGLWLKTALNRLRFMKTALAIMQPLLAMHCTKHDSCCLATWPAAFRSSPLSEQQGPALFTLISHYRTV